MTNPPLSAENLSQVDMNYKAFLKRLPSLITTHNGKIVVMHDGDLIEFFDSYADAVRFGLEKFSDFGHFSVQEISSEVVSMGYHSYAGILQQ